MRLTSANVIPETVESKASAAACGARETSYEVNRETYGGGEEGLPQWSSLGFSLRQWAEITEPGHRLMPQSPSGGSFLLWLESLHLDTQGRAGNSGCLMENRLLSSSARRRDLWQQRRQIRHCETGGQRFYTCALFSNGLSALEAADPELWRTIPRALS